MSLLRNISQKLIKDSVHTSGFAPLLIYAAYNNASDEPMAEEENSASYDNESNLQTPMWRLRTIGFIKRLLLSLSEGVYSEASDQLSNLVSIGVGSHSPADDFLVGLCAIFWSLQVNNMDFLGGEMERLVKMYRQIFISETDLLHAAKGNFSEPIHNFLAHYFKLEPEPFSQYLQDHWESLTIDCICGLMLGIQFSCEDYVWEKQFVFDDLMDQETDRSKRRSWRNWLSLSW